MVEYIKSKFFLKNKSKIQNNSNNHDNEKYKMISFPRYLSFNY